MLDLFQNLIIVEKNPRVMILNLKNDTIAIKSNVNYISYIKIFETIGLIFLAVLYNFCRFIFQNK